MYSLQRFEIFYKNHIVWLILLSLYLSYVPLTTFRLQESFHFQFRYENINVFTWYRTQARHSKLCKQNQFIKTTMKRILFETHSSFVYERQS